jgi:hypothetical protein
VVLVLFLKAKGHIAIPVAIVGGRRLSLTLRQIGMDLEYILMGMLKEQKAA